MISKEHDNYDGLIYEISNTPGKPTRNLQVT